MRFKSLESRIVTLFLIMILGVQLAGFVALRTGIDTNARALINEELVIGERVFARLLTQNAEKLTLAAQLLARDYGFLSAIATDDRETIASALINQGGRIDASLTLMIGPDRKIKSAPASTVTAGLEAEVLKLVDIAEQKGSANGTAIVNEAPLQVVVVPVKAPLTIGWVVMGFPIDQRLAADMMALSSLQVSILTRDARAEWTTSATTLDALTLKNLVGSLHNLPDNTARMTRITINGDDYSVRISRLAQEAGQLSVVVLQRSVSEATAPYRQLQMTLLILTGVGILIAVAVSVFTAKRITGPLRQLSEVAKRLGAGDYKQPVAVQRDDEIGELSQAFEHMRDDIAAREREIRKLAYWDTLTDLPNRAQFTIHLKETLAQAAQNKQSCFVLMMDLDRFKNVNDVLGHSFGDALLRKVAARLQFQVGNDAGQIARLGGDEFVVLLHNASANDAGLVAARILKSLEQPISLDDQTVDLGAGIGIAGFPEHATDAEALMSRAEVAMYAAKKSGNEAVMYDADFDQSSQQSLSLLSELRRAVENNELRLYLQPKLMLATGSVVGVEALVRWVHPERGLIYPDTFIPFSEKTGFIRTITRWILEQSAALCSELAGKGIYPKISINISARDLLDQDLPAKFGEILSRHKVRPSSFCLEITESAIMDDQVRAQQTLEGLYAMGVELSIDDFGTGYSSLAYLKRLPVHELKIDKSFVMNMEHDADDSKIVRSTIDLGHNMGLRVVAEGIESEEVWKLLLKMGCDQGQGYFMSKPIPANTFADWIATWTPPANEIPTVMAWHG